MSKTFLRSLGKIITGAATAVTFHSYYKTMTDNALKTQIQEAERKYIEANNKIQELEKEKLINQVEKANLESIQSQLETSKVKIESTVEKINALSNEGNSVSKSDFENLTKQVNEEMTNSTSLINRAIEMYKEKINKFIDGNDNFLKNFFDFIEQWTSTLNDLTLHQLAALTHLLAAIFIFTCLFSVIVIIYGDILLKYLNIEDRYPRIGSFIKLRRKFQQFYLFINLFLIIITLLAIIFINLYALYIL